MEGVDGGGGGSGFGDDAVRYFPRHLSIIELFLHADLHTGHVTERARAACVLDV